jgi:hypothetical protein
MIIVAPVKNELKSIVTFLTLCAANLFHCYTIHLAVLYVVVKLLIHAVEPIVLKLNIGFSVTVNTPAHAKVAKLLHFSHLLNRTMTGLTLHAPYFGVLRVVEINVVRKVVNLDPFDGFTLACVFIERRIPSGILI